jgi:hypothetical protein
MNADCIFDYLCDSINFMLKLLKDALIGKEQDYTKVNLKTGIVLLAIPMILEMLMESLFSVVDIFLWADWESMRWPRWD